MHIPKAKTKKKTNIHNPFLVTTLTIDLQILQVVIVTPSIRIHWKFYCYLNYSNGGFDLGAKKFMRVLQSRKQPFTFLVEKTKDVVVIHFLKDDHELRAVKLIIRKFKGWSAANKWKGNGQPAILSQPNGERNFPISSTQCS